MPRRSVLFSPGNQPDKLRKAPDSGADAVVFDLEDAVAPTHKPAARRAVRDVLADPGFDPDCEVCVRVNPGEFAREDLAIVLDGDAPVRLDAAVLPKATGARDVERLRDSLADHDATVPVLALIENAAGVLAAPEVAAADATDALLFGAEDLAADVGAERTPEGLELLYARERVVIAAAAAGVDAVDTLFTEFADDDGLRADARVSARLGFDGKLAIHPRQVPIVHAAFAPDPERVTWARRVLDAREAAGADVGVFEVDGEMIDAPLVAQAERVLARHRAGTDGTGGEGDDAGGDADGAAPE
jgi:citrate lyase subunit beta/citryl-CoA lyase